MLVTVARVAQNNVQRKAHIQAYAYLAGALFLGATVMFVSSAKPVQALPSYARQTGQECAACRYGFPELTP